MDIHEATRKGMEWIVTRFVDFEMLLSQRLMQKILLQNCALKNDEKYYFNCFN